MIKNDSTFYILKRFSLLWIIAIIGAASDACELEVQSSNESTKCSCEILKSMQPASLQFAEDIPSITEFSFFESLPAWNGLLTASIVFELPFLYLGPKEYLYLSGLSPPHKINS